MLDSTEGRRWRRQALVLGAFLLVAAGLALVVEPPDAGSGPRAPTTVETATRRTPPAEATPAPPRVPDATAPAAVEPPPAPESEEERERRIRVNEACAASVLMNLSSAQAQLQTMARADEDRDGAGEFGCFAELSGGVPVRGSDRHLNPPVLSGAFRKPSEDGVVTRKGYEFAIWLPGPTGEGVRESGPDGIPAGAVDPDLAETCWIAYAWPAEQGTTGRRAFAIGATGDLVVSASPRYSGADGPRAEDAVVQEPGLAPSMTGALLPEGDATAADHPWKRVDLLAEMTVLLRDGDEVQRRSAASALGWRGRRAPVAERGRLVPALLGALDDPSSEVRNHAGYSLVKLGVAPEKVVPPLVERLEKKKDEPDRVLLLHLLAAVGSDARVALPAIERCAGSDSALVRDSAAKARAAILGE